MLTRFLPLVLLCSSGALGAEPARDRFGDPLPEGAIARLGSLRLRHHSSVRIGDFTTDGKLLAAFDGGSSIIFWDVASGREARRVPAGRLSPPRWFRLSVDGKSLILANWVGEYRLVDAVTGAERLKLEPHKRDRRYVDVRAVAVSPDGKTSVSIYSGGFLVVWDLASGKQLREFPFRHNLNRFTISPIALTPDGKHLVAPHTDGSLRLFDVKSGKEVLAFEMPSAKPRKDSPIVSLSLDGRYLAFGGSCLGAPGSPCNSVTLCDMTTGKRLHELSSKDAIHEWAFTPDSRSLALTDAQTLRLFDVSSGKERKTIRKPKGRGIVFAPDGRKVAASFGTCISVKDVETGRPLQSPVGHDWFIREIHFFPDGKQLVSNTSGDMIVWDVAASRPVASYESGKLQEWIAVTADCKAIRFLDWISKPSPMRRTDKRLNERGLAEGQEKRPSGTETRIIYRWDLTTDRKEQHTAFPIPRACDWFVLSLDGQRVALVTLGTEPRISLRDVKGITSGLSAALPDNSRILEAKFSPDGRRFLLRSGHGALRVLDGRTGQLLRDLKPDKSGRRLTSTSVFTPDGRCVVLNDGQLRIREVASGKDRLHLSPENSSGNPAISPNGRFLALSFHDANDDTIRVFSMATGKLLARWCGKQFLTTALGFSPDNQLLATGGFDGTILLWKVPRDDELPAKLSPEEEATFWQDLADEDAARAHRALARLAAAPAQSVPLINERFPTSWKNSDGKQIARWIAELDDDAFKVREQATRELTDAGRVAAPALRQALTKATSPEAKRRIEGILNRLNKGSSPERLRALRAIEVLERIGTPLAKDVLRSLAGKSLPPDLREEVQAALRRLGDKP